MALSAHELILVLRARDEASRVLRGFRHELNSMDRDAAAAAQSQFSRGAALATIGAGVAAAGVAGAVGLNRMVDASMAYNEQAAKTLTQVDGVNVGLEELKRMGIDIASTMPVAFDQVQDALYDIFSSIDVNGPQAQEILRGIGKAAVGGKTDMETAGRGIVQVLNAWNMKASDTNHVNDVMFQLVRKGVGSYEEFTKTLGRAIPSARKAGQEVEDLAGMMAFLTRNGLNTAMAATSSARALDAMAKPKTIERMEKLGISVTDAAGNFRPMAEVAADLRDKLQGLSEKAKAAKLQELFKGSGGTIQAMRFFNLAVKDGSGELQQLTDNMYNAKGAAKEAYDIMANTPQAKLQMLNNQYEIMKTKIGDQLLPAKVKLAETISKVLDWFNKLSPSTQKWIARIAALAAGLAIVIGVIMVVVGSALMLAAAATLAGTSIAVVGAVVVGAVAAIGLLVAAGILIYKNWETIKAKGIELWDTIKSKLLDVWYGFANFRDNIMNFAREVWEYLGPIFSRVFNDIKAGVESMWTQIKPYWDQFSEVLQKVWTHARTLAVGVGGFLTNVFGILKPLLYIVIGAFGVLASIVGGVVRVVFETIGGVIGNLIQILTNVIDFVYNVFTGNWKEAWQNIKEIVKGTFGAIWAIIKGAAKLVGTIIYNLVKSIVDFFKHLWNVLVGNSIIPDMVKAILQWILNLQVKFIVLVLTLISKVIEFFRTLPGKVISAVVRLASLLYEQGRKWFDRLYSAVSSGWSRVSAFVKSIPGKIKSMLSGLGSILWNAGSNIISGLLNGIKDKFESVKNFVGGIGSWIANNKGPKTYDLNLLKPAGNWIMSGFEKSLRDNMYRVHDVVDDITDAISPEGRIAGAYSARGNSGSRSLAPSGGAKVEMTVHTQEINPVKHAADLAYEVARGLGN